MTAMPRWGITLPLRSLPVPDQRDIVAALPDLGYTDAWSSELNGADAFTPLALAAQWTDRLRLGTAIAGIFTRGPALLAMNAATLAALAPGRFVLGIGTSSSVIVEAWNGIELARPYQRARDTLPFLRAALAGEKVSAGYESFAISGFRLDPLPAQPPGSPPLRSGPAGAAGRVAGGRAIRPAAPRMPPRAPWPAYSEPIAGVRLPDRGRQRGQEVIRLIAAHLTVPAYAAFHAWARRGAAPPCRTRGRPGPQALAPSPTTSWTSWSHGLPRLPERVEQHGPAARHPGRDGGARPGADEYAVRQPAPGG
jgi:hypothetical protein